MAYRLDGGTSLRRALREAARQQLHDRRKPLKVLSQALGDWRDLHLLRGLLAHEGKPFHGELIPLLDASCLQARSSISTAFNTFLRRSPTAETVTLEHVPM